MSGKKFYFKKFKNILIIVPAPSYIKKLKDALVFLEKKDQKSFLKVKKTTKTIFIISEKGYYNETFVKEKMWLAQGSFIKDKSYPYQYLASLLLHEAHHIAQYLTGHKYAGSRAEYRAYFVQRKFLNKINYSNAVQWLDEQFNKKWWQTLDKNKKNINYSRKILRLYKNESLQIIKLQKMFQ
jgi:hypothetical protein